MIRTLLISVLVVLVVACTSTYGKPITEEQIASLEKGVTTEQELIATMGKPIASSVNSDGTKIYSWAYASVGLGVYQNKSLSATFSADGLLQSFTVSDLSR